MQIDFCFISEISEPRTVKSHSHPACELVYYTKGEGEILIEDIKYAFSRNYFTLTPAGTCHTQWNTRPLEAVCIGLSGSGLEEYQGCWHDNRGEIRKLCENLMTEFKSDQAGHASVCLGLAHQIVGMVARTAGDTEQADGEHLVRRALNIIREKEGDISVEHLSRLLYVSKDYLRHLIKDATAQSPIKHIINTRIDKARSLLAETDLSISAIADECGFTDIYYFSQLFKKVTSQAPTAYRAAITEKHK